MSSSANAGQPSPRMMSGRPPPHPSQQHSPPNPNKPLVAPGSPTSPRIPETSAASSASSSGAAPTRETPALSQEALARWGTALGNMHDLGMAVNSISKALGEAVYLDDQAYDMQNQLKKYKDALRKRESRNAALVAEVELTGRELAQSRDQNQQLQRDLKEAESLNATLRQEQENNAVVFRMHFNELLAKQEEIKKKDEELARLKGIIEVLQGSEGGGQQASKNTNQYTPSRS
mmetsp:Transcript_22681/g.43357  ORF Transcript_22681/g.43357 Transcript_22681/m.43357 type:complete len:233 (-) Transcript_22681:200-898(-)